MHSQHGIHRLGVADSTQPAAEEMTFIRHLHFEDPITVKINGHKNMGIIFKPQKG